MSKTYIAISNQITDPLPEQFKNDDVRYCQALVEHFLREFTGEGDTVLDPFMGFGTTLAVAEKINRIAYGIEFDELRCAYVRSFLQHPERALHGDALKFRELDLPQLDLVLTSPPYMGKHHRENPFTAYSTIGGGYGQYLKDIGSIFEQIGSRLKPSAHVVVEVSNLKHDDAEMTPLAWDIARELSGVLKFLGETIITWEPTYAYGYDHSYALVFSRR